MEESKGPSNQDKNIEEGKDALWMEESKCASNQDEDVQGSPHIVKTGQLDFSFS